MEIWNYHPTTGELLGPDSADPNPITPDEWLVPAHATTIAPPAPTVGSVSVFVGSSWSTVEDYRGETWWPTKQPYNDQPGVVVDFLGDPAARGLTKTEPPAPPVVVEPVIVSAKQIRMALTRIGLRSQVEAYVTTADQDTKDSWAFSTEFERDNGMVTIAAAALGKTPEEIDALFDLAKTL